MVQLGILTTEFECSSLEDNLDAIAGHHIGAVQYQLGSALAEIPLRTSLEMGLDALGATPQHRPLPPDPRTNRPAVASPWPRSTAPSIWWARTRPGDGTTSVTSAD